MTEKPQILIVDDRAENLYTLTKLFKKLDVEVYQANSGAEALNLTLEHDFCAAIVDIQMPEMDGYELVELLRSNEITATLPVIFVSAIYSDEYHHRKGYEAGAVDFMSKPFIPEILLSKVQVFINLYQQRQALQQANSALVKLNADKDKFFANISHDLRSPLNVLLDNAQFMLQETKRLSEAQLQQISQQNYTSTLTIYSLFETLITWSSMQRINLKYPFAEVNLRELAYQAVEVWREMAARKNVQLLNDIEEEIYVFADEVTLASILRNLLANGLKYTWSGDQVILSARLAETPEQVQGQTAPKLIAISVTDTGTGISPEGLARLFRVDVSHTTPGTAQETGAGLGLIMCKEMVEYNGGQIWIESKFGQSTTATFTVPLAAEFARYM